MGLDMYLHRIKSIRLNTKHPEHISKQVMYWRKANQIHNWFINNCAHGNMEITRMDVGREQLEDLLEVVETVLKESKLIKGQIRNGQRGTVNGYIDIMEAGKLIENDSVAKQLLPTQSGFFFGSTDYDQYYINDLKDTKKMLQKELKYDESNETQYEYLASW